MIGKIEELLKDNDEWKAFRELYHHVKSSIHFAAGLKGKFRDDVKEITDLKDGMELEGTVTNVTNFGAFVDLGVHQDGLVHISELSHKYVQDARQAVKVGEVLAEAGRWQLSRRRSGRGYRLVLRRLDHRTNWSLVCRVRRD